MSTKEAPAAPPHREMRSIDGLALVFGLVATGFVVAAAVLGPTSVAGLVALAAGCVAATVAVGLPWCRRRIALRVANEIETAARSETARAAANDAARWQSIVDTATEGIVTIDEFGIIETANGAALAQFGYSRAELIGRNVSMLMPEPYHSEHDGYLARYRATGQRRIIGIGREVVGRRKDGSEFPIDLSVGEGSSGGRRFFTAVVRDISDRKNMQTKLAQTERLAAVGELAAGVAHEINNPINTVINCAQLIEDGDDLHENCKIIVEEGHRIADIVRDLLQFARDDRDTAQPASLSEALQRTLRLLGENWKRHGIRLSVDVPEDLPTVRARPQQLQQVLLNLLINAKDALVEHASDDRRVDLCARPLDGGVELTVVDNGPGIPRALAERIFEPFVTTKRARGGTGLGLSISKSIVESYGGRIGVESELGRGSTFRVWLQRPE